MQMLPVKMHDRLKVDAHNSCPDTIIKHARRQTLAGWYSSSLNEYDTDNANEKASKEKTRYSEDKL